jgi:hypothetical protein
VAAVVLLAGGAFALLGSDDETSDDAPIAGVTPGPSGTAAATAEPERTAKPKRKRTPTPGVFLEETEGELAVGVTEYNPTFLRKDRVYPPFELWRKVFDRWNPSHYRLIVDWSILEPRRGRDAFELPQKGCMREIGPCHAYIGLRDQLRAIAARQRAGDFDVLAVLTGTPKWAAQERSGCERPGTEPRSRPPTAAGRAAYEAFVGRVIAAAGAAGAELRYWSAWNEPNLTAFIAAQRATCQRGLPSVAAKEYALLSHSLKSALDRAPGDQAIVLGELAGVLPSGKPRFTGVGEFFRALPKDVVCASDIIGQHGYIGDPDPIEDADRAVKSKGCPQTHEIWVTETGVRRPVSRTDAAPTEKRQDRACRQLHERLVRWYEDPRVTVAFQYTFREDNRFPTGMVRTNLTDSYDVLEEWDAWGQRRRPTPQAPAPKSTCR